MVVRFKENLERGKNSLTNSLEEKRRKKLLQLTPNSSTPSFSCTHSQSRTQTPSCTHPQSRTLPLPRTPQVESTERLRTPYQRQRERPWSDRPRWNSGTRRPTPFPLLPNPHANLTQLSHVPPTGDGNPFGAQLQDIRDTLKSLVSRFNN